MTELKTLKDLKKCKDYGKEELLTSDKELKQELGIKRIKSFQKMQEYWKQKSIDDNCDYGVQYIEYDWKIDVLKEIFNITEEDLKK